MWFNTYSCVIYRYRSGNGVENTVKYGLVTVRKFFFKFRLNFLGNCKVSSSAHDCVSIMVVHY